MKYRVRAKDVNCCFVTVMSVRHSRDTDTMTEQFLLQWPNKLNNPRKNPSATDQFVSTVLSNWLVMLMFVTSPGLTETSNWYVFKVLYCGIYGEDKKSCLEKYHHRENDHCSNAEKIASTHFMIFSTTAHCFEKKKIVIILLNKTALSSSNPKFALNTLVLLLSVSHVTY